MSLQVVLLSDHAQIPVRATDGSAGYDVHTTKTVTLEAHPHISTGVGLHASIHPCKHAAVMQKLCAELRAAGRETKAEQYLFLFLKFISAVCPTIEYDYTLSVDGL